MPIGPVDFQAALQKVNELSRIKGGDKAKLENQMQHFAEHFQKKIDQKQKHVVSSSKSEAPAKEGYSNDKNSKHNSDSRDEEKYKNKDKLKKHEGLFNIEL